MRSRILLSTIAITALSLSFMPANAGQYSTGLELLQGARAKVALTNGGTAEFSIERLQGVEYFAPPAIIPNSGPGDLPTLYGPFPTITGSERPTRYKGCISITVGGVNDGGCTLVSPTTATFDPALQTGRVSFSVRSKLAGYEVTASAIFRATGTPSPTAAADPRYYMSSNNVPMRVEFHTGSAFARASSILGSVRSDVIGGGSIKSASLSEMFGGTGSSAVTDRSMPVCTPGSKPGELPSSPDTLTRICPKDL